MSNWPSIALKTSENLNFEAYMPQSLSLMTPFLKKDGKGSPQRVVLKRHRPIGLQGECSAIPETSWALCLQDTNEAASWYELGTYDTMLEAFILRCANRQFDWKKSTPFPEPDADEATFSFAVEALPMAS